MSKQKNKKKILLLFKTFQAGNDTTQESLGPLQQCLYLFLYNHLN